MNEKSKRAGVVQNPSKKFRIPRKKKKELKRKSLIGFRFMISTLRSALAFQRLCAALSKLNTPQPPILAKGGHLSDDVPIVDMKGKCLYPQTESHVDPLAIFEPDSPIVKHQIQS